MKVQFLENNKIVVGLGEPKQLTKDTSVTSNRTVVGLQITIRYNEKDYDIVAYKKNELKEFTQTLAELKTKIEDLKRQ